MVREVRTRTSEAISSPACRKAAARPWASPQPARMPRVEATRAMTSASKSTETVT